LKILSAKLLQHLEHFSCEGHWKGLATVFRKCAILKALQNYSIQQFNIAAGLLFHESQHCVSRFHNFLQRLENIACDNDLHRLGLLAFWAFSADNYGVQIF